jgi:hypothetical protein
MDIQDIEKNVEWIYLVADSYKWQAVLTAAIKILLS